jgi:hypothetical protein
MSKADARAIAARGHVPPAPRLLVVRLHPKAGAASTIKVSVNYETEEVADLEFQVPAPAEGEPSVEARFLLVYGEGEPPAFAGIEVIDIDEGGEFAPTIEVSALRKKARELTVAEQLDPPPGIDLLAHDVEGAPLARWRFALTLPGGERREGQLDAEGRATVEDADPGEEYELQLLPPDDDAGEAPPPSGYYLPPPPLEYAADDDELDEESDADLAQPEEESLEFRFSR